MAKLGDCFSIIRNGASIKQINGAGGIPITRIETISNCEIDRNKFGYADLNDISKYKDYLLEEGDILMSHINSEKHLGKTAIYHKEGNEQIIHGMNLLMLRANQGMLYPQYANYYFESHGFKCQIINITKKSVNQASFTITALRELEIPLLRLNEQQKIVAVLDKVSDLIAKRLQQLEKLDLLVKAKFVEMFGDPIENSMKWPVKQLKYFSVLITNGNTPKGGSKNYINDGIIFLRSQNVWRNRIELDDVAYIDEETHNSMKKSSVHYKDILITKTGRINTENSSLGRAALFLGQDNSANINGHVYLIRLNNTVVPEYIVTILTGEAYRRYIRKVSVGGIDKRQINLEQVEEFPIILPPKIMQEQFTYYIEQINKLKMPIQKSLEKLETLKKALMQKYFG